MRINAFGLVAFACCLATAAVECARILAVSPIAGKSHWNVMRGVLRALTDRGHHVTAVTSHPDGVRDNYTELDVSADIAPLLRLDMSFVDDRMTGYADLVRFAHRTNRDACKKMYANRALSDIVAAAAPGGGGGGGARFDAVLVEIMAVECMSHLSARLGGVPFAYVVSPPLISYVEPAVTGHYPSPAVAAHVLSGHGASRTVWQRLSDAALLFGTTALLRFECWRARASDPQPFDLQAPVKPSLVFSNAHYLIDAARPLPPTVVQIGGIHLNAPAPIPRDILEFIENSPQGVIIFTLGSMVAMSSLPEVIFNNILEVLGQVPQKVLLKYENELEIDLPKNIMTRKWLPQRDILMHPNVKLFISHGGISGLYEAIDAGVPVLGFPVFYDQRRNLDTLANSGMAISLNLKSLDKDTFLKSIKEMINDEKYMRNARIASGLFNDRPMSPAEAVDYWTGHIIRHNGTLHLKPNAFDLTWYQYFLLDVLAIALSIVLVVFAITFKVLSFLKRRVIKSSSAVLKTKRD